MNNRLVWIGIFILLAATIVTVANCRKIPDPWEPKYQSSAPAPAN